MRRKSGAGESSLAKAYPDIAISGTVGARSWNILIDSKPGFAAIGYRHIKEVTFETYLDGRADHGIVIDEKHACHASPTEIDSVISMQSFLNRHHKGSYLSFLA